eukprot:SAG31_NODE_7450_length_1686_cov_1.654064_2_plen_191_part_00
MCQCHPRAYAPVPEHCACGAVATSTHGSLIEMGAELCSQAPRQGHSHPCKVVRNLHLRVSPPLAAAARINPRSSAGVIQATLAPQHQPPAPPPTAVPTQPQAQPGMQLMAVTCPMGSGPGTPLQIKGPTGAMFQVSVPPGVAPGQQFHVQVHHHNPLCETSRLHSGTGRRYPLMHQRHRHKWLRRWPNRK